MLSTHCHITFCDKSTGDSKSTLHSFCRLWRVYATTAWVMTTAWPAVIVQIWKTLPLGTHKRRHTQFPRWIVAPLHACFPSWQFHRGIWLIIHWPPFADRSSPCKCLNGQQQVAVLCKIGSVWISKHPRWREGRRTKSLVRFISSSRVVSGMLLGSPFLPTLSAGSRAAIWGALWASPLLRNYLCKPPGKN